MIYMEHYVGAQYWHEGNKYVSVEIKIIKNDEVVPINPMNVHSVTEFFDSFADIVWLQKWMQDYSDGDGSRIRLDGFIIKSLLDDCREVLADNDKAKEILPEIHFPFNDDGSSYDKEYFDSIKEVVAVFERMQQYGDSVEFIYVSY